LFLLIIYILYNETPWRHIVAYGAGAVQGCGILATTRKAFALGRGKIHGFYI
jgi:hypothetical protein